jgi:hypothetical protein
MDEIKEAEQMSHIRMYWRKYSFSIAIIISLTLVLSLNHAKKTPVSVQVSSSQHPASAAPTSTKSIGSSFKQTEQWMVVKDRIDLTAASEPIVLNRTPASVLYVSDQSLLFIKEGLQPKELFHWGKNGSALVWKWDEGILIGLPYLYTDSNIQTESGEWLYIRISNNGDGEIPTARVIQNFSYNPDDLLELRYSKKPELAIMTFRQPNSETTFESFIDIVTGLSGSINENQNRIPFTSINKKVMVKETNKKHEVRQILAMQWSSDLFVFSDEWGALLYRKYTENNNIEVSRYPLMELIGHHFIYNETDKYYQLYLQLKDPNNHLFLTPYNSVMFAPFEKSLWEEGWNGLNTFSFYRLSTDQLETIQYDYLPIENNIVMNKNTLPLAAAEFQSQNQSILSFKHAGQEQLIDIYDLLNLADIDQRNMLWLKIMTAGTKTRGEKPPPDSQQIEAKAERINLPQNLESDKQISYADLPDEIKSSVDTLLDPSGDYNANPLFRKFGNAWFWVIGDQFYTYDKVEKYKLIGTLPVQTSATIGQGAVGVGPKDFLLFGDNWIVLDTLGNRVLKLDKALHIINELMLPGPFQLKISSSKQFEVESLRGVTLLDEQLQVIHSNPLPFRQVLNKDLKERALLQYDLNPEAIIIDTATGWIWYYHWGSLYQYNTITKQARSFPIGYQRNFRIPVRLFNHGDQSVLLFDQFAYIFGKDGNWLKTIEYMRSEPDSTYNMITSGEGSFIWDAKHEVVYLNQGFRILAIDLKQDTAAVIFQQNMANTGPIILQGNQLFFTLQAKLYIGVDMNGHSTTELIKQNLTTYSYKRFKLDGYWEIESVKDDKLKLWSADEPGGGNYSGTYQTFSLDAFK